jgi:hypothetical protein
MFSFDSLLDDYLSSEHLLFLPEGVAEHAEGILRGFLSAAGTLGIRSPDALRASQVEAILLGGLSGDLGRLDLPLPARRGVPEVLEGFFAYLKDTGRFPAAGGWRECVAALADKYRASLRDDGSLRGETYRKVSSEVGRNDPCFCGSGRKYKKCCGA